MPRVVHFEINAGDPERAAAFYSKVFGWQVRKWGGPEDYWLLTTGPEGEPGIDGAIMRSSPGHTGTCNSIAVGSVDEFSAKVVAEGGKVIAPKMAIPGVGWFAYCQDTEGNTFGIIQNDPAAR